MPVPEGLMSRYAVKTQMLAPILDAAGFHHCMDRSKARAASHTTGA